MRGIEIKALCETLNEFRREGGKVIVKLKNQGVDYNDSCCLKLECSVQDGDELYTHSFGLTIDCELFDRKNIEEQFDTTNCPGYLIKYVKKEKEFLDQYLRGGKNGAGGYIVPCTRLSFSNDTDDYRTFYLSYNGEAHIFVEGSPNFLDTIVSEFKQQKVRRLEHKVIAEQFSQQKTSIELPTYNK